MTDMML